MSYDDSNSSWPKTFPRIVICIVLITVETILVYFWNGWRSSITFSMNENENKIFPSSHLLRKVFKGIFSSLLSDDGDGRFLADEDFWKGWWSVLVCSLATVESDSLCADRRVGSLFYTLMLESDRRFKSLSYTSDSEISLVVSRLRCVCNTPDA